MLGTLPPSQMLNKQKMDRAMVLRVSIFSANNSPSEERLMEALVESQKVQRNEAYLG